MRISRKSTAFAGCILALGGIASGWAAEREARAAMDQHVSDANREARILDRFRTNPQLHDYDLGTVVDGAGARLTGTVDSEAVKALAERVAFASEGILRVDNRIAVDAELRPPGREAARRSPQTMLADAAVAASIRSKLSWNAGTEGLDIRIDSRAGRVTLSGGTISYAEHDMAGIVAALTEGVVSVDNQLLLTNEPRALMKVDRAGEHNGRVSDSWISSRVRDSLSFTRGISRVDFTVTTRRGVVRLSGIVHSQAERDLAMQVAQDIRGVKRVDADALGVG